MTARFVYAIAEKEFLENVLSWRFALALGLASVILVTSVLVLGAAYAEDRADYERKLADLEGSGGSSVAPQRETFAVLGKPNPLGVFVGGPAEDLRQSAPASSFGVIRLGGWGEEEPEVATGSATPVNLRFDALDLAFVAVAVMTFMAVLFSYDAVSGERERGTLKLMLANPLPKDAVLLGKYLGGMASILLPFALAVLVALPFLGVAGVSLAPEEWRRLGLIVLLFVPLASAFYLLGLTVSSLSKRSATSLLALALVWLLLVFGAGNVAAVVAKESSDAPSGSDLAESLAAIADELSARTEGIQAEMAPLLDKQFSGANLTVEEAATLARLQEEQSSAFDHSKAARKATYEAARAGLDAELKRAESLATVSPAEAFRSLAMTIAGSDYWSHKEAMSAADEYQREVALMQAEWMAERSSAGGFNIQFGGSGGFQVGGETFEPPRFEYSPSSLASAMRESGAMRDLLVLVAWNAFAFAAAYVAFLRYDVR